MVNYLWYWVAIRVALGFHFSFLNKQELSVLSKPSGFQRVNGKFDYRPAQLKLYSTSASSMKWKLVIEILFSDCQHWIHSKYLHS